MACMGIEFIGEKIIHKNKTIYTGKWITGELERISTGCYIDGIEVAPETVGQVTHRRFNDVIKGDTYERTEV